MTHHLIEGSVKEMKIKGRKLF